MEHISKKRHALHSFKYKKPSKIDKICYFAKLTNATVIGLSKTKLDNAVLSNELEIEGDDLIKTDKFQRGVVCFVNTLFHIIVNLIFALIQRVFIFFCLNPNLF